MMYDFGTGVEELAYAAHHFGYRGSVPFQDWSLEDLRGELAAGRPVVVALGEAASGHFVTLTGISPAGDWVSYNDPALGAVQVPVETFLEQWNRQGRRGVAVRPGDSLAVSAQARTSAWVALAAGVMALVSATPLGQLRKGIGGRPGLGGTGGKPPYPPPPGKQWVQVPVVRYGYKDVPVQKVMTVPKVEKVRVQVDTRVWYDKKARYKTVRVDKGEWAYRTVTRCRTERYLRGYRRYRVRRSYTYRRGGRRYTGYRYEWRSTPIYGTRQVGYATRERYWEPNWVTERRFDGYEWIRREEPVYDYLYRTVGTREVTYSTTEQRWGVIGSDHEWQLRDLPQPQATATATHPLPTPTPTPYVAPSPSPTYGPGTSTLGVTATSTIQPASTATSTPSATLDPTQLALLEEISGRSGLDLPYHIRQVCDVLDPAIPGATTGTFVDTDTLLEQAVALCVTGSIYSLQPEILPVCSLIPATGPACHLFNLGYDYFTESGIYFDNIYARLTAYQTSGSLTATPDMLSTPTPNQTPTCMPTITLSPTSEENE